MSELISKVTGYKVNIQKLKLFLYIINKQLKMEKKILKHYLQ